MPELEHHRKLDVILDRVEVQSVLNAEQRHDINQGGLYDARSGCVNIWCSPEGKADCWDVEISAGVLDYPRSYVGAPG